MTPAISWVSLAMLATSEGAVAHARRKLVEVSSGRERARAERKRQKRHKR